MKLTVLICSVPWRDNHLTAIMQQLFEQTSQHRGMVDVLTDGDENKSIGRKRNDLLERATTDYLCFIDDDDSISDNYIKLLLEGIDKGVDCCSLLGMYFVDGKLDGFFEHSLKYKEWKTNDQTEAEVKYERYPNHLNCIKSSIAKQFKFPDKNFGEDHDWSKQIHESGLIKTEHYIPEVIYYYKKVTR